MASTSLSPTPSPSHNDGHFILIPLMSQSHLIPFFDLARLLARRGVAVTVVTTPLNAARFKPSLSTSSSSSVNLNIRLLSLPFPAQAAGLPADCENLDALPSLHLFDKFLSASRMLLSPLQSLLQTLHHPPPTCIISDVVLPWTSHLSRHLQIPRLVFHVISCFTLLCSHNLRLSGASDGAASESDPFLVPNVPHRVQFTSAQLPNVMAADAAASQSFTAELAEFEASADGVLVNSFQELEPGYVNGYSTLVRKLWCVGPVSQVLSTGEPSDKALRGNRDGAAELAAAANRCLGWLDSRPDRSVVYACFGSQSSIPLPQMVEIGLGLEAANRPFVWVIRKKDKSSLHKLDKWMEEEGFEERVGGRGLIVKGWAPQVLILSHRAVGAFVTHCGWNSTLEAVSCGVPMVTWPLGAEQFFNEKFVVQVLRTGARVGVERVCMEEGQENGGDEGSLVRREEVRRAVEEVMGEGEEAVERRERARELGKVARRATEEGGSSDVNMGMLIQEVMGMSAMYKRRSLQQDI